MRRLLSSFISFVVSDATIDYNQSARVFEFDYGGKRVEVALLDPSPVAPTVA
jgi:hypothetical protein